jgi:two-component system OmpR family sensor kinase/two-component system phosphate regulon sensor histidine kinase PhoR
MKRKLSFTSRILFNFSVIIALFTVGIILFEQQQFKDERTRSLERVLENNADIVRRYLNENAPEQLGELLHYMPSGARVTVISREGRVLYDNQLHTEGMENHLLRPEIRKSTAAGDGANVRISASNNVKYLYYAKKYGESYFIRLAVPYDVKLRSFVNSGNSFIYYILFFFAVCIAMMLYFSNRFSTSLKELRAFSLNIRNGSKIPADFAFADDEVGEVSADIMENYNLLQENRRKLIQHFQLSEEGIAIFSADRKEIYANSHFLQFLNVILDKPAPETELLFDDPALGEFVAFLDARPGKESVLSKRIAKSGRQFNVRPILFEDESFELYISDVTKSEKMRLLKQEMTNNIAHELRTPVTSIRGYLETVLLRGEDGNHERIRGFLDRAYAQAIRLSELIQDISMLTKIEEAPDRFELEPVKMEELLNELANDLSEKLKGSDHRFEVNVDARVVIYGSRTLLYSIFRNLIENAISYTGEGIEIVARCYNETENTCFFEFYDTGTGVEEKHLVRIFERFYRVNEGRTRKTGGSGLGLSIVKNAVLFHKGSIAAKNRPEGGLHFLMTFPKNMNRGGV